MKPRFRSGGLAAWAIRRPIAVSMLALALTAAGLAALQSLSIDLLPKLIYPSIRVRVLDPGVPSRIMEDQVTRQLEEQLAITEGAVDVQSFTREGRSAVDLFFPYGQDINEALRDASARLDRAKRFLPDTIDPPIIYKQDPGQAPVLELVVSSDRRSITDLSAWVDYTFSKRLINLPGVAAAEVGGGAPREISVELDQERLAALGLSFQDVAQAITSENRDVSGGKLTTGKRELPARVAARARTPDEIAHIAIQDREDAQTVIRLGDVADVRDGEAQEQLRIRLNGIAGVKVTIRKQPQANTVAVVDNVLNHVRWMRDRRLIPPDIHVHVVNDQAVFIRHALRNAASAAGLGALLAMAVVFLFLGNLRRTLIVSLAIPLALLGTFLLMELAGLTLNLMTLGGLALGIGILVDSTIVMLENIYRHQREGEGGLEAGAHAAAEVNSAIVASTTTNLAAVVPFLFISGLVGLLFRELIFTISAAMAAAMVVALTLVPTLAARVPTTRSGVTRSLTDRGMGALQEGYARLTGWLLQVPWLPLLLLLPGLAWAALYLSGSERIFLPDVDEGRVLMRIKGDPGMQLDRMDTAVRKLEAALSRRPEVETLFTQAGGWVYGRTQWISGNRSTIAIQLKPRDQRELSTREWVRQVMDQDVLPMNLVGFSIRMTVRGQVSGIRVGTGEEDLNLRISGPDLDTLTVLGAEAVEGLADLEGLNNVRHTYRDTREELEVVLDRARAADLGVSVDDISRALRVALDGLEVSELFQGDRSYAIRLRLPPGRVTNADELRGVIVALREGEPVRIGDVAHVDIRPSPANIFRDKQIRAVEITASLSGSRSLEQVTEEALRRLANLDLPPGYTLYDDGELENLRKSQRLGRMLLGLAVFLVFVVMAVQYESLRNPLVILLSIPFTLIGVTAGLYLNVLPLSMPVWLGMIMLAGIVVNNAIVLVEQVEVEREAGRELNEAVINAARNRLRPILMTTLTTVAGMLPLAMGIGEGAEMLQPLAVVIVWGLSFSTLVSLILVPAMYRMLQSGRRLRIAPAGP